MPEKATYLNADGSLHIEYLNYACESTATTHPHYGILRERCVIRMAAWLTNLLDAGLKFVLIWDGSVAGQMRNPDKLPRSYQPSIFRAIDKAYVYVALRALGFPTVLGWTEGEKICCEAVKAGVADCVLSGDTDSYIIGADIVAERITAKPGIGNGGILEKVVARTAVSACINAITHGRTDVQKQLIDMAVFLGNDFNPREYLNGPAKYIKRLTSGAGFFIDEIRLHPDLELVRRVNLAIDFFTTTPEGLAITKTAVNDAFSTARIHEDILVIIGLAGKLDHLISRITRGPIIKARIAITNNTNNESSIIESKNIPSGAMAYE
jgi:hypothetical protein